MAFCNKGCGKKSKQKSKKSVHIVKKTEDGFMLTAPSKKKSLVFLVYAFLEEIITIGVVKS